MSAQAHIAPHGLPAPLADFLLAAAGLPFLWGQRDCALWVADWIFVNCGFDPAVEFRGTYFDRRSCYRVLKKSGGLLAVANQIAHSAGMSKTSWPLAGDIVCGIHPGTNNPTMMIASGERGEAFAKGLPLGIAKFRPNIIAAWQIQTAKRIAPSRTVALPVPGRAGCGRLSQLELIT